MKAREGGRTNSHGLVHLNPRSEALVMCINNNVNFLPHLREWKTWGKIRSSGQGNGRGIMDSLSVRGGSRYDSTIPDCTRIHTLPAETEKNATHTIMSSLKPSSTVGPRKNYHTDDSETGVQLTWLNVFACMNWSGY